MLVMLYFLTIGTRFHRGALTVLYFTLRRVMWRSCPDVGVRVGMKRGVGLGCAGASADVDVDVGWCECVYVCVPCRRVGGRATIAQRCY